MWLSRHEELYATAISDTMPTIYCVLVACLQEPTPAQKMVKPQVQVLMKDFLLEDFLASILTQTGANQIPHSSGVFLWIIIKKNTLSHVSYTLKV